MSEYSSLLATINANVKANNNHEITGSIMNSVLNAMVNSLGAGYQFVGVATPTNTGSAQTPDYKCFYIATTPGTYTNLGGLVVADGEVAIIKYDTSWTKDVTGIATAESVSQLDQELDGNMLHITNAGNNNPYNTYADESYLIVNDGATANIFARVSESSENIDIAVPLPSGKSIIYNAQVDATIIRTTGAGTHSIKICNIKGILPRLQLLEQSVGIVEDHPTYNSNYPISSKGVFDYLKYIHLVVWDSSNLLSRMNVGEYSWNTSTEEIVYKKQDGNAYIITPQKDMLFLYKHSFYIWNGNEMEVVYDDALINGNKSIFDGIGNHSYTTTANKKYLIKNTGNITLNVYVRVTEDSDNIPVVELLQAGQSYIYTATVTATIFRFAGGSGNAQVEIIEYDALVLDRPVLQEQIDNVNLGRPFVQFDNPLALKDVSSEVSQMDYSHESQQSDVLEQVYALFDGLVSSYPQYVSRVDVAEEVGLSYPEYATLGGNQGLIEHTITFSDSSTYSYYYDATPTYKTYMYKFINSQYIATRGHFPRKKILIVSGTHGNEIAAPFNTYLFAKQLCEAQKSDFFKLVSAFDVYIIPCLCGYGMYHPRRCNANYVNLNRNYPVSTWEEGGNSRESRLNLNLCDYTGPSAGSEFETQLVTGITNIIKPDMAIDHHNYAVANTQFYVISKNKRFNNLSYQALIDCSCLFIEELSSYFGNVYKLFTNQETFIERSQDGLTSNWWTEQGIAASATIEISQCINYLNGVYNQLANDNFGNDTFSVAEFTFRNLILKFAQWVLDVNK